MGQDHASDPWGEPEPGPVAAALARVRQAIGQASQALTPVVEGDEVVPAEGGAVIAFNHVSPVEWLRAPLGGRRVQFVGDAAGPARWRVRRNRSGMDELLEATSMVGRGELVGMFPEDDRSPDGRLYRGRTQAAALALATGVPLLPAAVLLGQHPVTRALAPRIVVGEPLDLDRFRGEGEPDDLALRTATDQLMYRLMELSGQTYVDVPSRQARAERDQQRRSASASRRALREAARAAERARVEQRRADRAAEAAELARAQALAAQAARHQAQRAAAADATRRAVRDTRQSVVASRAPRDVRDPRQHEPHAGADERA